MSALSEPVIPALQSASLRAHRTTDDQTVAVANVPANDHSYNATFDTANVTTINTTNAAHIATIASTLGTTFHASKLSAIVSAVVRTHQSDVAALLSALHEAVAHADPYSVLSNISCGHFLFVLDHGRGV